MVRIGPRVTGGNAAWDALSKTRRELQSSALMLVERMIEAKDVAP